MPLYNIYAGLSGAFGGANYIRTVYCDTKEEAESIAYQEACEIYYSQQGCGIEDYDDFYAEAQVYTDYSDFDSEEEYFLAVEEYANQLESEAKESWIDYYAILKEEDPNDISDN